MLQVTNQMVAACRNYITENGLQRIWDQDMAVVKQKIAVSVR